MRADTQTAGPGLKTTVGVVGLLAAATTAALLLFTVGAGAAIIMGGTILVTAVLTAALAGRNVAIAVLSAASVALAVSSLVTLYGVAQIVLAFTGGDGSPAPRPDPVLLDQATTKIQAGAAETAFRLELSEEELNAVLQNALAEANNPFRTVAVDITNAVGEKGRLDFVGEFKDGLLDINGTLATQVTGGKVGIEILDIEVGMFTVPGVARSALEDMIADLADLQAALAEEGADVQDVVIGNDRIVVTGTNRGDGAVDASSVIAAISDRVDLGSPSTIEPKYEPGRVNTTASDGDRYYVALGDSLAANIGVVEPRDGYVSRFHGWLEQDNVEYGLRNYAIPGETSGSLLNGGQLEAATTFAEDNFVTHVTIDIGANDLLGHLTSPDCSEDLTTVACEQRLDATLEAYASNIDEIFTTIGDSFPDATVILLTTYNPFGFGFEERVAFESASNTIISRLNAIAATAASEHDFLVADGFEPMRGIATSATHMVDAPPDIHPNIVGFDILAGALIDAVS